MAGILHLGTEVTERVQRRQLLERYAAVKDAMWRIRRRDGSVSAPKSRSATCFPERNTPPLDVNYRNPIESQGIAATRMRPTRRAAK